MRCETHSKTMKTPPTFTATKSNQIILAIDPGYDRIGFAVLAGTRSNPTLITMGCLTTNRADTHSERLNNIAIAIKKLISVHHPTIAAVEQLFFSRNVKTALKVAEARGVIMNTFTNSKLPIQEFSPQAVKIAATGHGAADKKQVLKMLKLIFKSNLTSEQDDAADALALALCALTQTK